MWHSASSAWRLTRCPWSASPVQEPMAPAGGVPTNIGIVVHLAVQDWINSNSWMSASPDEALVTAIDDVCRRHGLLLSSFDNGVLTCSRVSRRAVDLALLLRPYAPHLRSEVVLRDHQTGLFGILDLVSPSGSGLVVDLKTGFDGLSDSDALEFQLSIYAHLFRARFGKLPGSTTVFSFLSGARTVEIDGDQVQSVLKRVKRALQSDLSVANPDPFLCRFCHKRLNCEAYWEASAGWPTRDSLQGVIRKIEVSASGLYSFIIDSAVLNGVRGSSLVQPVLVGQSVRVTFVRQRGDDRSDEWQGDDRTRIKVLD